MRSKNGFTLIELLISVLLSMFLLTMLYTTFGSLMNFQERWLSFRERYELNGIFIKFQEQLLFCRDFKVMEDGGKTVFEYYTTAGYSSPYVRVKIIIGSEGIIYSETDPINSHLLYEKKLSVKVERIEVGKEHVLLNVNSRKFLLLVKEAGKPPITF